ncbi:MAG TPA: helix-turn-helix domain-containing protein [Puia sp.]|nr:helix-turn-helix domain-containing protein [Puia sp.]
MTHGRSPYTSAFYTWKGASAVFYSSCLTPFHRHSAIQLILDTQQNFRLRTKNGEWNTYRSLIIKENVVHQLDTNHSVQLIIYLEPATEIAQAISAGYLHKSEVYSPQLNIFHFADSNQLQQALLRSNPSLVEALMHRILTHLSQKIGITGRDERVMRVEQMISTTAPAEISMRLLAAEVCLSESRLRALFRDVTGIPLYRYILWNKIRFATNRIMAGDSVNGAAMEAGFADGSHYHKMMVQMFGMSPSTFLKENLLNDFVVCERVK